MTGKLSAEQREKVSDRLAATLQDALNRDQLQRFGQLELQRQGLFALLQPAVAADLKVTPEQRRQFMSVVMDLQTQVQSLLQQAGPGANPADIRPKVLKLRHEHERKLEDLLSAAQKQRWKDVLGKPMDLAE